MELQVPKVRAAYHQVADELRNRILVGTLPPGEKLPYEGELSTMFGVGRSSIREGLRVLESEGLVYSVRGPQGGTFVTAPDPQRMMESLTGAIGRLTLTRHLSLADMHEARMLIEPRAARLAAERADEETVEKILAAAKGDLARAKGTPRLEHDVDFHKLILAATGNFALVLMEQPLLDVIRLRGPRKISKREMEQVFAIHMQIAEAIARHDADEAEALMTEHVENSRPD